PSDPRLEEPAMRSAVGYVELAERVHGPIARPVDFDYIWGDALDDLTRAQPDVTLVNLETAVTTSESNWPGKGIHYRMHPANIACLQAARIDCCTLANNHVLDWGHAGLEETLRTLAAAGIRTVGAGESRTQAEAPVTLDVPGRGRVVVIAAGMETSGIPRAWAATDDRAGVHLLPDLSAATVRRLAGAIAAVKRAGDVVVVSLHWGPNWGHAIPRAHDTFARALIDDAGVDVVHGHSSHHPLAIALHEGKLILFGGGDILTDYEGISGHESFRPELGLMYFAQVHVASGRLEDLQMLPTRMRRLRVTRADEQDAAWLRDVLSRKGAPFGTRVELGPDGRLLLHCVSEDRPRLRS
ncbi:MAG: CapA family protein, partial [Planctomycetota bacterium]